MLQKTPNEEETSIENFFNYIKHSQYDGKCVIMLGVLHVVFDSGRDGVLFILLNECCGNDGDFLVKVYVHMEVE